MPKESLGSALDYAKFRSRQLELFKSGRKPANRITKTFSGPNHGMSQTQALIQDRFQSMLASQEANRKLSKALSKDALDPSYEQGPNGAPLLVYPTLENNFRRDTGVYTVRPSHLLKRYDSKGRLIH